MLTLRMKTARAIKNLRRAALLVEKARQLLNVTPKPWKNAADETHARIFEQTSETPTKLANAAKRLAQTISQ